MDLRGRKRYRNKKGKFVPQPGPSDLDDGPEEVKTATIPECNPCCPQEVTSHDLPLDSGRCVTAPTASTPRSHSPCTRLTLGRSPSPARMCRQREHTELQVLNERLSSHADHVKQLQAENARLRLQVEAMDDVIQRESHTMKQLHGSEIKSLQDIIDACTEEKASLSSLFEEEKLQRERLGAELWDKDAEIASLCEQLEALKVVSENYRKLRLEFEAAEAALAESRQDAERLSEELLKEKRSTRRLEQEASSNKGLYLREVEQAAARFSEHIHQADQKLEEGYETMVSSALTSLRQQHVRDLEGLRSEMTNNYQSRITEWKSACEIAQADLLAARREVKVIRQEQDKAKDLVTQLKSEKAALEVQVRETQVRLEEVKDLAERDRCQAQREVALLTQELSELKEELEEMGGANTRLEAEINAYRLIVEDLEGQPPTNITEGPKVGKEKGSLSEKAKSKERKKKRVKDLDAASKVRKRRDRHPTLDVFRRQDCFRTNEFSKGIEILDMDLAGRYITLINTTAHPADLCLWSVQQTDGQLIVKYELGVTTQLPKGKRLTIWSCDAGPGCGGRGTTHRVADGLSSGDNDHDNPSDHNEDSADRPDAAGDDDDHDDDDGLSCGVEVTMAGQSWLKLSNRLTVRVEDGDGQLQAKCDFSSITSTSWAKSNTAAITTGATTRVLSRTPPLNSGNKRRRLGWFIRSSNTPSSPIASSSETRFNKPRPLTGLTRPSLAGGMDAVDDLAAGDEDRTGGVAYVDCEEESLTGHCEMSTADNGRYLDKDNCAVM